MRRYALCGDQWERIKDLLPGREGWVGVTAKDDRPFVEAVLYRYRAGIHWRDLPERFGGWKNGLPLRGGGFATRPSTSGGQDGGEATLSANPT